MEKINNIVKKKSYYNIYHSAHICYVAKKIFCHMISPTIEVVNYKNKIIKIKIANNYIANEIKIKKRLLLDSINKKLKTNFIKDIKISQ